MSSGGGARRHGSHLRMTDYRPCHGQDDTVTWREVGPSNIRGEIHDFVEQHAG